MITVHNLLQELKAMGEDRHHVLLRELLVDNVVQTFDDASILTNTNGWRRHLAVQGTFSQDIHSFISLVQAILSRHEEAMHEEEEVFQMLESIEEENEDSEEEDM